MLDTVTVPHPPVAVHAWPQATPRALQDLRSGPGVAVISVALVQGTARPEARERIRMALRQTIAGFFQQPVASIALHTQPGQAVRVASPACNMGLSISHEADISVAALRTQGAVGLDVMRVDSATLPDWELLAHDYLGPGAHKRLAQHPPDSRAAAFAQEWTRLEACLKALGLGLTEWTPALAKAMASCHVSTLDLPAHLRGAVAIGGW